MRKTIEERKEYAKVIAKAWVDDDFKKRLIADPAAVLGEHGIDVPEGMSVKVVERKENEIHIPLPPKPKEFGGAEELMERVQASSSCSVF